MAHKRIEFLELRMESAGSEYGLFGGSCEHSDEPLKYGQVSYKRLLIS